ncbi:chitodextrinase [Paenibacillus shirakamiensis]|uniref:Chitodextrinase n=1 Tax=Paenibacillus shirakamiensis TaxID=1265935 RepID=A0ABS4JBP1_9BACL|nr:fibronectin type III domain-containing protein [Paenibacillus shirakamiensis]MBP1999095.1 chitodextrinase [Paenibacillus shirakamiensis]
MISLKKTLTLSVVSLFTLYSVSTGGVTEALSSNLKSAKSKTMSKLAVQALAPTTPTNLKSSIQSDTTLNVEWTASTDDSGIANYEIYINNALAGTVGGTQLFYTVTGLTAGTTYTVQVKAKNTSGVYSDLSQSLSLTTLSGKKVYEFEKLADVKHSGDALSKVNEKEASGGYHVFYQSNEVDDYIEYPFQIDANGSYEFNLRLKQFTNRGIAQVYVDNTPVGDPVDFYNVTARYINTMIGSMDLDASIKHSIKFKLIGKNEASSNYILALDSFYLSKKEAATIPSAPTAMKSTIQSDTSVNLEWTAATDAKGISSYEIYEQNQKIGAVPGTQTYFTATKLTSGQAYKFKVKAKNQDNVYSDWSNVLDISTLTGMTVLEFESLTGVKHSGKVLSKIGEKDSSDGYHTFYESNVTDDYIEYPFQISKAGKYQLDLRLKQFTNRGMAQMYVDGAAVGKPIDFYNSSASYKNITVGDVTLDSRATHAIKFVITGKNTASSNYIVALDAFYLKEAVAEDTLEPNNSIETASDIPLSHTISSNISSASDQDYYKFTPTKGGSYSLTLKSPTVKNYKLEAVNASGKKIAIRTTLNKQDLDVSFSVANDESVYLRIYDDLGAYGSGPYLIRISPPPHKVYTYNAASRLTKLEYEQGLYQYVIQYDYDSNGNCIASHLTKTLITN